MIKIHEAELDLLELMDGGFTGEYLQAVTSKDINRNLSDSFHQTALNNSIATSLGEHQTSTFQADVVSAAPLGGQVRFHNVPAGYQVDIIAIITKLMASPAGSFLIALNGKFDALGLDIYFGAGTLSGGSSLDQTAVDAENINVTLLGGQPQNAIFFDMAVLNKRLIIDQNGDVRGLSFDRGIIHEMVHALSNLVDNNDSGPSALLDDDPNFLGETVIQTNVIMAEAAFGIEAARLNYTGFNVLSPTYYGGNDEEIVVNLSLTDGTEVSYVYIGNDKVANGNIDDVFSGSGNSDLLLGFRGDDTFLMSAGDDWVYGGPADDTISYENASLGTGGGGDDTLGEEFLCAA